MNSANKLLSLMAVVAAISPDNGYLNSRRCRDCYYYSDVTVKMCEMEHEPADPEMIACHMFEPKEDA
jgi:hypothetical protein